jgi:hypothetical protein
MMINFILLKTYKPLNEEQKEKWLNIVFKFLTNGSILNRKVVCQKTSSEFKYKIFLKSEISMYDAEFIVSAWENYYTDDFCVEINVNENVNINNNEYFIDKETKEKCIKILSKFLHNRWVDSKMSEGWRYGMLYNKEEKVHPSLRDWDTLPNNYRNNIDIDDEKLIKIIESHPTLFG